MVSVLVAWYVIPQVGWRYMVGFAAVPSLGMIFFRKYVRESPRYLMYQDRADEAKAIVQDVAHQNKAPLGLQRNIGTMHLKDAEIDAQWTYRAFPARVLKLFSGSLLRVTIAVCVVWFCASLAGVMILQWFPLYLTLHSNSSSSTQELLLENSFQIALLIGVGDVLGGVVLYVCVDEFERRTVLRVGLIGMLIAVLSLNFRDMFGSALILVVPLMTLFRSACVTVLYTYAAESFPTSVRSLGIAFGTAAHRFGPILSAFVLPALMSSTRFVMLGLVSCLLAVAITATFLLPWDTRDGILAQAYYDRLHDGDE